jgi:pimeloyl-ACP methyl ester carboxylesterase/DNA-binding CsgD family transcriptional regulator
MPPETRYARSGEISIAHQIVGRGPIDLVFGLGGVSNLDAFWEEPRFARFVERLAAFARVILYDKRGTGLSDAVALEEPGRLDDRVADLRAVMRAAGCTSAALFDISAGGAIAARFAAVHPELVDKLIIFAGFARRRSSSDYPWGRTEEAEAELLAGPWGSLARVETALPSVADDLAFQRWWPSYLRRSAGPGTAHTLAQLSTLIDIRDDLPNIEAPTLILHRTGDRIVSIENGRYLAAHIPGAQLRELPGEDHLPFIGNQEGVLRAIERFLTGADSHSAVELTLSALLAYELVGAMETAVRLGDRQWSEHWMRHRALVRTLAVRHDGQESTSTHDGGIVGFGRPAAAVAFAQDALEGLPSLGLSARFGLHMGEVVTRDGVAAGVSFFIAKRVMEQAAPGELLVTGPTYDLLAGSSSEFHLAGVQVFHGLPGEWRLFRLGGAGGAQRAPSGPRSFESPLDTLSRREREIAALLALGRANRRIADDLTISVATVERHVANILLKLGFHSRAQVASWAVDHGLLLRRPGEDVTS